MIFSSAILSSQCHRLPKIDRDRTVTVTGDEQDGGPASAARFQCRQRGRSDQVFGMDRSYSAFAVCNQ